MKNIIIQIIYFLITIVLVGSIGIWLPAAIDFFPDKTLSAETKASVPSNLLTYYLGLFGVALIDRLRWMVKAERYKHKEIELLLHVALFIGCAFLTYFVFQAIYQKDLALSIKYASFATVASYIVWWFANYKSATNNPYNALGGEIQ